MRWRYSSKIATTESRNPPEIALIYLSIDLYRTAPCAYQRTVVRGAENFHVPPHAPRASSCRPAKRGRRTPIGRAKCIIEPADAAETGGKGDLPGSRAKRARSQSPKSRKKRTKIIASAPLAVVLFW